MRIKGHAIPLSALVGMAIVALNVVAALFAPWLAPYGEADSVGDIWAHPSAAAWLGNDNLGRDMLTRLLYGARNTIGIASLVTTISFTVGVLLGIGAAVFGRLFDMLLSRLVDLVMSVPVLIFALVVLSALGTSLPVLIGTVALLDATRFFRLSRALAMDIVAQDFVEAARLRGERAWWVIRREVLPNALPPLQAEIGLRFCFAFLFIAALSFLGLGIQPPDADWGSMVRENSQAINFGGLAPLVPAGAIALLTVGVNLVVDWLIGLQTTERRGAL
jgi:peptide/nickel transport system permease protein